MLYSLERNDYVRDVPHRRDYDRWNARLPTAAREAILAELRRRIDGDEIHTSSWIPGADWTGTVFEPIYSLACGRDEVAAAQFFGLLLWQVVRDHPDVWAFGRYEKDGTPIEGLTYFRIAPP